MVTCCQDMASRYPQMTDEEIIVYARAGHSSAVDYLISKYRHLVESKARTYFLAGADTDDVIQEGMIGLFKAIRDYRTDRLARFRAFADLCVTRQIITAVKSATRQKHIPLNGYVSLNAGTADLDSETSLIDTIPDEHVEDPAVAVTRERDRADFYRQVYQMLSGLEAEVLDYYLEGRSYREMSERLHCGTKRIDNALQRVKRKIAHLQVSLNNRSFC